MTARPFQSRWMILPAFLPALLALVLFWLYDGRPQDVTEAPLSAGKLNCASYAPFRDGQSPFNLDAIIPRWQIEEDLKALSSSFGCVRTYTTNQGIGETLPVAAELGMKVLVGAWISRDPALNEAEIKRTAELANKYPETVEAVIVGNEVLLRGEQTEAAMAGYLRKMRGLTKARITYAEVWEFWTMHKALAEEVDFVTVHLLPYWENEPAGIDIAIAHVGEALAEVKKIFPGKHILVGETGWPSAGRQREGAAPGLVNQARFIREFVAFATAQGVDYNLIEAFDQPWKRALEGTVGGHWGIYAENRTAKWPLTGPVRENPRWALDLAASLALAAAFYLAAILQAGRMTLIRRMGLGLLAAGAGTALTLAAEMMIDSKRTALALALGGAQGLAAAGAGLLVMMALAKRWAGSGAHPRPMTAGAVLDLARQPKALGQALASLPFAFGALHLLFVATALALNLGLVFDPRYRDFPVALYLVPAAGFALWAYVRRDHKLPAPGGEERILAAGLVLTAIAIVLREGPLNMQALGWAITSLLLAFPWTGALRAERA